MFPFTKAIRLLKKAIDLTGSTREKSSISIIANSHLTIKDLDTSGLDKNVASFLGQRYLEHRFDLLGSGWILNSYDQEAPGFGGIKFKNNINIENYDAMGRWLSRILLPVHLTESQKIWSRVDRDYIPIDWQKDIKSGFRWNAGKWYLSQRKTYYKGADLKMPWEIARFHHMPQLAVFTILEPDMTATYVREFRNQVLDFIATNPPRMGINWTSTMEVSIRAINMLIAYDLFCQLDTGIILDQGFKQIFCNSIYEHGYHIVNNLEFRTWLTSNHYLSNITGLLFISSYLDGGNETSQWMLFALQEINNEIFKQFLPDGVNFESSTSYHRLSGEMILLSLAMALGIDEDRRKELLNCDISGWKRIPRLLSGEQQKLNLSDTVIFDRAFVERTYLIGKFIKDILKSNHEIPQFGDNDSGRILRLSPAGEMMSIKELKKKYLHLSHIDINLQEFWDENMLQQGAFLAYFDAIFEYSGFQDHGLAYPLERSIILNLSGGKQLERPESIDFKFDKPNVDILPSTMPYRDEHRIQPDKDSSVPLDQNIRYSIYPYAGFIIIRSDRIYLTINAMPNGQNGNGGHCHNDKLSIELNIDEKDIYIDPGTFVYTAWPEMRNTFRSVRYHNTLVVEDHEQNAWKEGIQGLFRLSNDSSCRILECSNNSVSIYLKFRNIEQVRTINIHRDHMLIKDYSSVPFSSHFNDLQLYSNGYGKLLNFEIKDERFLGQYKR